MASTSPQPEASTSSKPLPSSSLLPSASASSSSKPSSKPKKKPISPGIVYISRIPPGMTPQKIKHLMGRWGETGKVYAQKDGPSGGAPGSKSKTHSVRYTEAWIEFLNKSVARSAAEMLNAQPIGGAKGERWRDDIWTMKYLPGFKWEMLGEQVAYERASHTSRLRQELSRSKTEQSDYLRNVELARVLDKRREKKKEAAGGAGTAEVQVGGEKGKRKYEQRGRDESSSGAGGGAEGGSSKKRSKRKGGDDGGESAAKLVDVLSSVF